MSNSEGNHGEDVKELYYYLDATPTHSYLKMLYKYCQSEYPYSVLCEENRRRGSTRPEYELIDSGVFDGDRYFDVFVEYALADPDDVLMRITARNRAAESARLHLLPQLWFRNTWSWAESESKPSLLLTERSVIEADHPKLGKYYFHADGAPLEYLFCDNESNLQRLWQDPPRQGYWKDAFHERVVHGRTEAVNPDRRGTKAAVWYCAEVPAGGEWQVRVRLAKAGQPVHGIRRF